MKTQHMKTFLLILAATLLISGYQALEAQGTPTEVEPAFEETTIVEMATPMMEELLNAVNQNDYDAIKRNFNEKMMAASTSDSFKAVQKPLSEKYGDFHSIEYLKLVDDQGYLNIFYSAEFEKGNLTVQLVLGSEPPNHLAGLCFR